MTRAARTRESTRQLRRAIRARLARGPATITEIAEDLDHLASVAQIRGQLRFLTARGELFVKEGDRRYWLWAHIVEGMRDRRPPEQRDNLDVPAHRRGAPIRAWRLG